MNYRALISLLVGASALTADTLVLKNGTRVDGNFMGGDARSVRFAVGNQINNYSLNDISSISFESATASSAAPQSRPPDTYAAPASAPPSNGPGGVQVPAGTQIVVRLIDAVDSQKDSLGQTYRASIDQPVVVNGASVIPRGADAVATLIDAQKSGKIQGRTVLTLDLKTVTINGKTYDIVTTGVPQASDSRGAQVRQGDWRNHSARCDHRRHRGRWQRCRDRGRIWRGSRYGGASRDNWADREGAIGDTADLYVAEPARPVIYGFSCTAEY